VYAFSGGFDDRCLMNSFRMTYTSTVTSPIIIFRCLSISFFAISFITLQTNVLESADGRLIC